MKGAGRWLLLAVLAASLVGTTGAFPAAGAGRMLAVDYDLQGKKAQLSPQAEEQLRALLMYAQPDVIALQSVPRGMVDAAQGSSVAKIASALGMYYVFQPTTDALGSVLLSRYRIQEATCLNAPSGAPVGLRAILQAPGSPVVAVAVRPPSPQLGRGAIDAVSADVKSNPSGSYMVLASFNAGGGAAAALSAWTKASLADPAAGRRGTATATYPSSKPAQRADLILVSPSLRAQVSSYEVYRRAGVAQISDHLPVVLSLRR